MIKLKKYKYPIIFSTLSLTILLTFQHCGKGSGASDSTNLSSSPLVSSTSYTPNSYFVEFKNVKGTTDSVMFEIVFAPDHSYKEYMIKFFNGNYDVGYYRMTKGIYTLSNENKLKTIPTEDTCNDLDAEELTISGTPADFIYATDGSTVLKFYNYLSWTPTTDFKTTKVLIQDTECNKF